MEQSVDSIGNCSLDVDAASEADLITDSAEASSLATLKSVSLLTPTTSEEPHHHHQHHHHLPSYLSLACTVNGYSTTTNYDPIRLSRSRDASPHRCGDDDLTASNKKPQPPPITYTVQNNLLSPPNLVPLPITNSRSSQLPQKSMNMENTLPEPCTGEFYSSKTITFLSTKESHCYNKTSSRFTRDTTDGTVVDKDNRHIIQSKCVSFESKNIISLNGQTKCVSETNMGKEITNGTETKSFIQQRVERLYGPGALAQGFFVSKRQKNKLSESDHPSTLNDSDEHSKSSTGDILESNSEPNLKQSNSSPTLPVMRHLRPEFRAQLPIVITPKKESFMQKNSTIPELKVDTTTIQPNTEKVSKLSKPTEAELNTSTKIDKDVKDGNYFLKILEDQTKRLLEQADDIESLIDAAELTEDINGKLRSAAGKARLLVSQKMQQFRGLCVNNINQSDGEAFPTTNEDLQGFWDMVMLQVDQVDALYREIQILKNNNWQEIAKSNDNGSTNGTSKNRKTVVNRNIKNQTSAVNEEARKQREARRKQMIEERRKAMRAQMKSKPDESSIEIYVPESS